jgi:hypothetical protein
MRGSPLYNPPTINQQPSTLACPFAIPYTQQRSADGRQIVSWKLVLAAKKSKRLAETELYSPVCAYLQEQGYTVRSEVEHCDVVAVRGEELIVIELKTTLNLPLIAQAVDRQKITDSVYVAVPRPQNHRKWMSQTKSVQIVLKRLEIGLILVSPSRRKQPIDIIFHPVAYQRRKRTRLKRAVLTEIEHRSGDYNQGGSCRRKLVTAYREKAIHIACCLSELGPVSPKKLRELGTDKNTQPILYNNVYAWFERVDNGIYALAAKGKAELAEYPDLSQRYCAMLQERLVGAERQPG